MAAATAVVIARTKTSRWSADDRPTTTATMSTASAMLDLISCRSALYGSQQRAGYPANPASMTDGQGILGANHGSQCPLAPPDSPRPPGANLRLIGRPPMTLRDVMKAAISTAG